MLKNKNGFQVNISLSIFFIAFCDLFTDFPFILEWYIVLSPEGRVFSMTFFALSSAYIHKRRNIQREMLLFPKQDTLLFHNISEFRINLKIVPMSSSSYIYIPLSHQYTMSQAQDTVNPVRIRRCY
jgi:hypothetical protein